MSQAPIWITEPGSLGVVPEGRFYRVNLEAYDPDFPGDPSKVTYSLIAGALPEGVQVNTNGTIEGIPVSVADFKGVPAEVSQNTISKFAIRVVDEDGRIADRTFTLTVSGQDRPRLETPEGEIGEWIDSTEVDFQFEATDRDPGDTLVFSLNSGNLPNGVTLNPDGSLTGFIEPVLPIGAAEAGFDRDDTLWDEFPWDFGTKAISTNYEFTIQVTDGKDYALGTYSMFVYSRNSLTADNDEITVDSTFLSADMIAIRSPYILNFPEDLGEVRHDNYFAYQFQGDDPGNEQIEYLVAFGSLPPGLELDDETGWLHGHLPNIGLTSEEYQFGIIVRKITDPSIQSQLYITKLKIFGDIDTNVEWVTDEFLGILDNGSASTFTVEAIYPGTKLLYRLAQGGVYNKLPQGLELLTSGNIVGKASFKTFSLDGGTTTFDSEHATRLDADPTTFDLTYRFTVEAFSTDGYVSVTKEFIILINREYETPHNILYAKALPPLEDRALLDTMLLNQDVLPRDLIYRGDDPNFGSARRVIYQHAFGLSPASLEDYFAAMELNHYNKKLVLGELRTARALDDNDEVMYEVVYARVVDKLVNEKGEGPPRQQNITYPALDDGSLTSTVYPNNLNNMREQVVDQVGQVSKVLPRWMLSKQENGDVLGFTPAWVIAYVKPGKSELVKYKIERFFGTQLNLIDFEIDRFTLDSRLSLNWNNTTQEWNPGVQTTFDRNQPTADSTWVQADDSGAIDGRFEAYQPPLPIGFEPRDPGLFGNQWETIFDGGSCRFTAPVDKAINTDKYDKYVKFPKTMIVNNKI